MDFKRYEHCCEFIEQKNKIVTCADKQCYTKYIYENESLDSLSKYRVDGCLINDNDLKCDFLLINRTKKISYFVELKGSDLIKAVEQIDRSINVLHEYFKGYSIQARIVLTRVNTTDLKSIKLIRLENKLKKMNGRLIKQTRKLIEKN